ncbi:MAG: diadenylate cyclase, partial [Planctomycetia bacterium]
THSLAPDAWPHEAAFLASARALALALYDGLDPTLRPAVGALRLVATGGVAGFRAQAFAGEGLLLPEDLREPVGSAVRLAPAGAGAGARSRVLDAWRRALQGVLEGHQPAGDWLWFAGEGRSVEGGALLPIVRLSRAAWKAYYSLRQGEADLLQRRPACLLDAVTTELLQRLSSALLEAVERDSVPTLDHDPEEVLAAAGRQLADRPALGEGTDLSLRGLFQTCTTLASVPHEGQGAAGRIIIAGRDHPGLKQSLVLAKPVRLHDVPVVRKLLVSCREGLSLLSDGAQVYALGQLDASLSLASKTLFVATFLKHSTWELARGVRPLMRVTYGRPRLPQPALNEARFRFYVTRTFSQAYGLMSEEEYQVLLGLARAASEQAKGTILLISSEARDEAERLAFQGMPLRARPLDPGTLRAVSSMDGAVLVGMDATCFGIGVILDGLSTGSGDPARGARYNSALRYVLARQKPCLAVVVSEDGRVDLLCK